MPYCSDGALQFLRLARLRRCFIFQMCAGPLPFGQPTHAAYIVSSSFSFSLLTFWDRLGVRGKMVGANVVGRTVFLDLGSVNVEFAKRHGLLSMRSCAMRCCGKMIALASCHRLRRVCREQAKHERLHQGIHTMFRICIFLLASRVGGHCLQKDDILFSPSAYNAGQFCLQCQPQLQLLQKPTPFLSPRKVHTLSLGDFSWALH